MDKVFIGKIKDFLSLQNPTDAQAIEGATLLLQVSPNRYRGIYNSARKRPLSMLPWIRTELKKQLAIRNRGLVPAEVPAYNKEVVKKVKETLSVKPSSVKEEEVVSEIPILGTKGKRKDHESLPEEIKGLWDTNAERWKQLSKWHHQLSVMIAKPGYAPCDGNELCFQMCKVDTALRADYKKYDSWQPGMEKETADKVDSFIDNVKTIQNARTAITRGLKRKTPHTEESLAKLNAAVETLIALNQKMKVETVKNLNAIGIEVPEDYVQA